jgi:carbon monoxide dehydrogenase subunit G
MVIRFSISSEISAEARANCGCFWPNVAISGKAKVGPKATMTAMMCRISQNENQFHVPMSTTTPFGSRRTAPEYEARPRKGQIDVRFEERATIAATPDQVWQVLSDWERQASWMPDVAWMRLLGPERELGAKLEVRTKVFGVPLATDLVEVIGWEPPRRLAIRHVGVVGGMGEWSLAPTPQGTSFTWIESFRMSPPILGDLGLWLYSPWQGMMLRRSIRNLKRIAEGRA